MRKSKITGIVSGYLEEGYALEVLPCIFRVTVVSINATEPISANSQQIMIGLHSFITRLNQELHSTLPISHLEVKEEMEWLFKELEAVLQKNLLFIESENTSLEMLKRINQFATDYKALSEFINKNVEK